jgi:8-oxo-dGTP pyrophosphatase MutT (NUDIX family)
MAVDLFPIVKRDNDRISVYGFVNRHFAHTNPLRHLTVNLIASTYETTPENPIVLFHKRCPHKEVDPDKLDIAGGHVTLNDFFFQELDWNGPSLLTQTFEFVARREAREEIQAQPSVEFRQEHFHRFEKVAHFQVESKRTNMDGSKTYNYEYSTVFVVVLNPRERIWFVDDCPRCNTQSPAVPFAYETMLDQFSTNPHMFADGSARILKELVGNPGMRIQLRELLTQAMPRA